MGKGQDRAVAAYLAGLDMSAVYVVGGDDAPPFRLGFSGNPGKVAADLQRGRSQKLSVRWASWCARAEHAELVVDAVRAEFVASIGRDWIAAPALVITESIERQAAVLGVTMFSRDEMERTAIAAVHAIDARLEQMRRTGDLKAVNKKYGEYRQSRVAQGQRAAPYSYWMATYRLNIIREAGVASRMLCAHPAQTRG